MVDTPPAAPKASFSASLSNLNSGMPEPIQRTLGPVLSGEVGIAVGIIAILVVLILPMPAWFLDFGLVISLFFSVLVLMLVLFIQRPLDFNSFPTILLISTMLRLSLNLASTRLILSEGHKGSGAAGEVIQAFSTFIMGGNFVIGIIVFSILVLVNFIVITKGAGRIAEVAARFTLDALPGKQMAIDADLSAGMIDEVEAQKRRIALQEESMFMGSMDGAAKFVRGDAIAGLIITGINIIGGIIIGVAQKGLSFSVAADNYTQLTVGDGLASQVPGLLISLASGMLVTKGGIEGTSRDTIVKQLMASPVSLGMTAALLILMAFVPQIPALPFLALGLVSGGLAYWFSRPSDEDGDGKPDGRRQSSLTGPQSPGSLPPPPGEDAGEEEPITNALKIDTIRLELGYALLSLVNEEQGQRLTEQIKGLRRQIATEMGFIMPSVRIQDNLQLQPNNYRICIKEIESGAGEVRPSMLMIMDPKGEKITLPGHTTIEPTFGLEAKWVDASLRDQATFKGYTVVDPPTVITTHLTEVIKSGMSEMLSYSETQKLLNELDEEYQKLVQELIPAQISVGAVQRVLKNLLTERISIRDLPLILEGISEALAVAQTTIYITEIVRMRLSSQICDALSTHTGYIAMVPLSTDWEQELASSIVGDGDDRRIALAPTRLQDFMEAMRVAWDEAGRFGEDPVLVTSVSIRPYLRRIIERVRPQTRVISQSEIHPKARLKTVGQL